MFDFPVIESKRQFVESAQLHCNIHIQTRAEAARADTLLKQKKVGGAPYALRTLWFRDLPAGQPDVLPVFGGVT